MIQLPQPIKVFCSILPDVSVNDLLALAGPADDTLPLVTQLGQLGLELLRVVNLLL